MTWPPTSRASAAAVLSLSLPLLLPASPAWGQETAGIPWTGEPGITETVAEIMARERRAPKVRADRPRPTKSEIELRKLLPPRGNPSAPAVSRWPLLEEPSVGAPLPFNPQAVGTSFLGIQLSESGFIPPDSMGDVGPTQILVAANGRIKVFDKAGVLGGLNVGMDTFFNSVRNGASTSDPHVRYDRLSQRWFITIINVPTTGGGAATGPNRILIAVSSGATITSAASFTFFQFQQDLPGGPSSDTNGFADYDTLGVDRFALYIGANIFNQTLNDFVGTTGWVVNKANLLAGTLTVTAFRQMAPDDDLGSTCNPNTGPLTPQGVANDDPAATEGYFVGVDMCLFNTLQIRRVSNPGGAPTLSGNLAVSVPLTRLPIPQVQPAPGETLDALDDRLYAAVVRRNKITGVSTLWTAHNLQVNASGVAIECGVPGVPPYPLCPNGRNGSRWYEIGTLTAIPSLVQSGTLFDNAGSNPLGYWIPSVAASGQGHMVIGASRAGAGAGSGLAGVAVAGRLRTDGAGNTQAPTLAQSGSAIYAVEAFGPQRWGDYSQVGVDPNDDMTMWTFQEYTNAGNSWAVRAIRLVAPPPATPDCSVPAQVPANSTQNVTINGTSSAGSGFFDPGPDTGGPGFANRIAAAVSGGVTVNSVTFNNPTSVTLNVTTSAVAGPKNVTITNPDGQNVVGTGCINVTAIADLSITKTDGSPSAGAGSPVTYTIVASNAGPSAVTGATVSDTFPASLSGVTWTCSASSGSSCPASGSGNISASVNLLFGGTATFTATGTLDINASGTLVNTATVAVPAGATDPVPGNNSATDTDTIRPPADLSITKTDGQTTAAPGQPITYTIVAGNAGPNAVVGATVSDVVPASLLTPTWSCAGAGGGTCTAAGAGNINDTVNLPVGGTVTYTLMGTVSPNPSSLSNTATIAVPASMNDPNPANNSATDTDTLMCFGETVVVPDGRLTQATVGMGATAWFAASLRIGNAYSVEFKNLTGSVPPGTLTIFTGDDACSPTSTATVNPTAGNDPAAAGGISRVSFIAAGTDPFFRARLVNTPGAPVTISFGWSDLTLFSPAWTTNGAFNTFYSFQNTTGSAVNGTLTLLDTSGNVLSTAPVVVPANQTASVNTSTLGVTRNRTGTARFVHNGPPGAVVAETAIANFSTNPAYVQPVKFQPVREAK
jgi:uncharacterized repeat protein (TIGR01451 family)